jgi:uncharacterized protein (DUF3820 family)
MPFGQYRGLPFEDIPREYLWFIVGWIRQTRGKNQLYWEISDYLNG